MTKMLSNDNLLSFHATGKVLFLPQLNVPDFLDSQWKVFYFLRRGLGISWGRWQEGEGGGNYGWYVKQKILKSHHLNKRERNKEVFVHKW